MLLIYLFAHRDDKRELQGHFQADTWENTAGILSGEQSCNVDEAIANRPLLHSSVTVTLIKTLVHIFHWFSSHPSLSRGFFKEFTTVTL